MSSEISTTKVMKLLREDMKEISDDLSKPDIYFEETRMTDGSPVLMPLVALKTNPCSWLKKSGGCVTCGYQLAASLSKSPSSDDIIQQTKYTITAVPPKHYPLITFNSAGSFLDTNEISDELRPVLLGMLERAGYKEFNFECRPEYLLATYKVAQIKEFFDIVSVGIGLESSNDYIRNKIIHKGTAKATYLRAAEICNRYGIDADVYIQLGKPFLTPKEDIEDAVSTANFAFENGFTRVFLMLCNIQPSTLTHYLWEKGLYKPPELWRAVEVLKALPESRRESAYVKGFNRAIPTPLEFPQNCGKCTSTVADKLIHWNLTGDFAHITSMPDCACLDMFKEKLDEPVETPLEDRVERAKRKVFEELTV